MEQNRIIIQGDCIKIMKDFPNNSVNLIIIDSPYGDNVDLWDK